MQNKRQERSGGDKSKKRKKKEKMKSASDDNHELETALCDKAGSDKGRRFCYRGGEVSRPKQQRAGGVKSPGVWLAGETSAHHLAIQFLQSTAAPAVPETQAERPLCPQCPSGKHAVRWRPLPTQEVWEALPCAIAIPELLAAPLRSAGPAG